MDEQDNVNELDQYTKTYSMYDHIISLQKFMASVSQIYLGINAAIWVIILSNKYQLDTVEHNLMLGILLFASVWLGWLLVGITSAIKLRFILLEEIGLKYFPNIKRMGEQSYVIAFKGLSYLGKASWGKSRWFWFIFPSAGFLINIWLILRVNCG